MTTFNISPQPPTLDLDADGNGKVFFTVTNASGTNLRGRASVETGDAAKPEWFAIVPPEEREFPVDSTLQFDVTVKAKPIEPKSQAPSLDCRFRLRVVDPRLPDELGNESDWIPFKVQQGEDGPVWWRWWPIAAAAVLVLAIAGGVAWYFNWGPGHKANVEIKSRGSTEFGTVQVRSASPASLIQLHNSGNKSAIVTINLIGTNAADFTRAADTCTGAELLPGRDCEIDVAFAPTSQGTKTAQMSFMVDSGNAPEPITLRGTAQGVSAICFDPKLVSLYITYRSIPLTMSKPVDVGVTNCGTATLSIDSTDLSGDADSRSRFKITNNECSKIKLEPGKSCTITLVFSSTIDGQWRVLLELFDDAANSPQQVPVVGIRNGSIICKTICLPQPTFASIKP